MTLREINNGESGLIVRNKLNETFVESYNAILSLSSDSTSVKDLTSQLMLSSDFNNFATEITSVTSTFLQTTTYENASGNWQSTYNTVQSNSAVNWDNSLVATYVDNNFLPLSGGTLTGNLEVNVGDTTTTLYVGNSSVGINTENPNTALTVVGEISASETIYASNLQVNVGDTTTTLYVGNSSVGINTENPNTALTVVGNISATGVFYGDGSNLTGITSGDVEATTLVRSNSANWETAYSTVQANSATNWDYQGTDIKAISGNWETAYSTVQANSATNWNYQGTDLKTLSADWQNTYTIVQSNSAAWSSNVGFSTLIGNNTTNPLTATHNLNTKNVLFSIREVATDNMVQAAGRVIDNNNIELTFNSTPTINQYYLTVLSNGGTSGTAGGTTNTFALVTVTTMSYIQNSTYTHNLYNDTAAGGTMTVYLLPPASHVGVTQHKKIGSTANVVLSAPSGSTIDGYQTFTLMNQYEAIGLYTDGTNYFIQ